MNALGVDSGPMTTQDTDRSVPDLRFVPVESIVPHEQHDDQRMAPLVERFKEQGVLRNPPVVAPFPPEQGGPQRFMVLDGANRSTAARAAGLPHILVQVVEYHPPSVALTTWYHAIASMKRDEIARALAAVDGLATEETTRMHASAMLARREALAWVGYADGSVASLHGGTTLRERNDLLNAVVDTYRSRGRFYRVTGDSLEAERTRHPDVNAIVVFPHFEPDEVMELATSGERLPAGITRHLIRWRALHVNMPFQMLTDTTRTLEEKNRWLGEWLADKLSHRAVRFYEEPTVLFDE